jgi:hypothetical protein
MESKEDIKERSFRRIVVNMKFIRYYQQINSRYARKYIVGESKDGLFYDLYMKEHAGDFWKVLGSEIDDKSIDESGLVYNANQIQEQKQHGWLLSPISQRKLFIELL